MNKYDENKQQETMMVTWLSGKQLARVAFQTNDNLTLGEIQDIIIIAKGGKVIKTETLENSDIDNYYNIGDFVKPSHFDNKPISKNQLDYMKSMWKNLGEYETAYLNSIIVPTV